MNRNSLFLIIFVLLTSCSTTFSQKPDFPSSIPDGHDYSKFQKIFAAVSPEYFFSDTSVTVSDSETKDTESVSSDSNGDDTEKQITELLERAREHYLTALQAMAEGDSSVSADEFEEAIKHLNEASYYSNIEENADFNELTRSVVEDYEKYIATIDSLGINSSIFALREKLNLDIEKIDITNIQIPESLIPKTTVPLHINEYTKRTISFFMGKGRPHMENWINRSGKYFPLMSRIFEEEGLPPELMILSMPESGLNPVARSWAKAVGMWQFMKSTGGIYGLRSNYWYDERRDFEKATRAAARHMKDLYREFKDWHLVFVAYNAGSGWVRRGIRRSGSHDYWEMRRRLPRETRNYVPQYIAVALIVMRPDAFGFGNIQKADSLSFEKVTVDDCIDLAILADCAETDLETLKELNPELTQWCTPPNYKGYQLRVPFGKSEIFAENYAKIPDERKLDFAIHTIRRGETISAIANRYRVTSTILLDVNGISRKKKLRIGSTLVIPVKSNSASAIVEAQRKKELADKARYDKIKVDGRKYTASRFSTSNSTEGRRTINQQSTYIPKGRAKIVYKVQSGETIGHIAEWFNVRASHIRNWNNIPYGRYIHPGQKLAIWVPQEKLEYYKPLVSQSFAEKQKRVSRGSKQKATNRNGGNSSSGWAQHKVKRGESLEKIASLYDVAIVDLQTWNRLKTSRIYAGEILEVYAPDQSDESAEESVASKNISPYSDRMKIHTVQRGETLEKIGKKYGVSISDLKKWNGLRTSRILVGQKLMIKE